MWLRIRASNYWYFVSFTVPLALIIGYLAGGGWTFGAFALVALIFPVLDQIMGKDETLPLPQKESFYAPILFSYAALNILLVVAMVAAAHTLPPLELIGLTFSTGMMSAFGWNVAHELMHKNDKRYKLAARALLSVIHVGGVFEPHHLFVHHNPKFTCAEGDYSVGRFNQSYWRHLALFLGHEYSATWRAEKQRLQLQNKPLFSHHNLVIVSLSALVLSVILALAIGGLAGLVLFLGQRLVSVIITYGVTYLQHYGLERSKGEAYSEKYAWNCDYIFSNYALLNLPRHAQHHATATLPYEQLVLTPNAPRLPHGYFGLIPIALLPPLWFKLMNSRVAAAKIG